jgi:hypothetical protein|tara:strand:- start:159 stop:278 length:120 start_codon:yes stop_codon:yes gene_type:complete
MKIRKARGFIGVPKRGAHINKKQKALKRSKLKLELKRNW